MKKMLFFASLTLVLSLNAFGANSNQSDSTRHETVGNGWKGSTSVMPREQVAGSSQKTVNASKLENLIERKSNNSNNESGSKGSTQPKESKSDKSQSNSGSKSCPSNKSGSGSSSNSGSGTSNASNSNSGNKSNSGPTPADKSENCKSTQCEQDKILNSPKPNK